MGTRYHIKLDIEGALKNKSFEGFTNEDGSKASKKKVEKYLKQCLSEGKVYLPFGDCEGFIEGEFLEMELCPACNGEGEITTQELCNETK